MEGSVDFALRFVARPSVMLNFYRISTVGMLEMAGDQNEYNNIVAKIVHAKLPAAISAIGFYSFCANNNDTYSPRVLNAI